MDLGFPEALACFSVVITDEAVGLAVDEPIYSALEVLTVQVRPTELLADPLAYGLSHGREG